MNTLEQLQKLLKLRGNTGMILPDIRYFDGIDAFSTSSGQYKSETLEGALSLFLEDNHFN